MGYIGVIMCYIGVILGYIGVMVGLYKDNGNGNGIYCNGIISPQKCLPRR